MNKLNSNKRSSNGLADEHSLNRLFNRYSNVLEMHLRYRQPSSTVMCPLISGEKLAPSKYFFMCQGTWVATAMISYVVYLLLMPMGPTIFNCSVKANPALFASMMLIPSIFALPVLIPLIYVGLLWINLRSAWNKDTPNALQGPTHLSLSPLAIKLLWKGAIFTALGPMFGWDEIISADLNLPDNEDADAPTVIITARKGKIVYTIPIRLDGFQSKEDMLLFLHSVDNRVSSDCKTDSFKEWLSNNNKLEYLLSTVNKHLAGEFPTLAGLLTQDAEHDKEELPTHAVPVTPREPVYKSEKPLPTHYDVTDL